MEGSALRVLIAPDCFGDSLTAVEAAEAIAAGWQRARPADALTLAPQSDGGPGFVGVLASRLGELRSATVSGPLADDVTAEWVFDAETGTAYIECAQACGLTLLGGPPTVRTALDAHSRGVGQLIAAALDAGATEVVVGLGGSSCTDGGRGLVEALGGLPAARECAGGCRADRGHRCRAPSARPDGCGCGLRPAEGRGPGHGRAARTTPDRMGRTARHRRRPLDRRRAGCRRGGRHRRRAPGVGRPQGVRCRRDRRAHPARGGPRRDRARHHRRGQVRRPVAARQGRQRAWPPEQRTHRCWCWRVRSRWAPRRCGTQASRPLTRSPSTQVRCSVRWTTRPISWQGLRNEPLRAGNAESGNSAATRYR